MIKLMKENIRWFFFISSLCKQKSLFRIIFWFKRITVVLNHHGDNVAMTSHVRMYLVFTLACRLRAFTIFSFP